jgi:LPS sulfotransferase NodH
LKTEDSFTETLRIDSRPLQICRNPVFVIGSPRSGTTMLAVALSKHPAFWASDETFFLYYLFGGERVEHEITRWASSGQKGSWLRRENVSRDEFLGYLGTGLNALFTNRSGGRRWIDHTPRYTLMADTLASMFPGAFFLHILRDGRHVVHSMLHYCESLTEQEQTTMERAGFLADWATNFRKACVTWAKWTATALDFCDRYPDRALTVRLEKLERDPVRGFRHILKFLEATASDAPARYFSSNRINSSFSTIDQTGDAVTEKRPDPWGTWTAEQQQIFKEEAAEALARCGFAPPEDSAESNKNSKTRPAITIPTPVKSNNRSFILLSVARSGSNLLRDCLNQHESIQCFGEIFKKSFVTEKDWGAFSGLDGDVKRLHETDLVSFWKLVLKTYKQDKPVIGAKIFYYHRHGDEIWHYFARSATPIIHLIRPELIDSYLSLKLAEASGIWKQPRNKRTGVEYDRSICIDLADFERYCARTQRYINQCELLFRDNPYLEITYSALVQDLEKTMSEIYSFLRLRNRETSPRLVRQLSRPREELIINWNETASFIKSNDDLCVIH